MLSGRDYVTQEGRIVQTMNERVRNDRRVTGTFLPFAGGAWLVVKK